MRTTFAIIAFLCACASSATSGTVPNGRTYAAENPPTNEREFMEAAERVVQSSMPADEKILQLEEIRTEILLLRKKKAEKDRISKPSGSPEEPPKAVGSDSQKRLGPVTESHATPEAETFETPEMNPVHRLIFAIFRIAGYAIALGSVAAFVFIASEAMDRFGFFIRRQWYEWRPFRKSPAVAIPKDGAVPAEFR